LRDQAGRTRRGDVRLRVLRVAGDDSERPAVDASGRVDLGDLELRGRQRRVVERRHLPAGVDRGADDDRRLLRCGLPGRGRHPDGGADRDGRERERADSEPAYLHASSLSEGNARHYAWSVRGFNGERFRLSSMRVGICEWTTFPASFEDDLRAYGVAGAGAIGILEPKLEGVDDVRGKLRESGLAVSACLPAAGSILPSPLIPGPEEPEARVESICRSVARFAELEAACVFFLTGPGEDEAVVREGIRHVGEAGERHGVRV